jgi:hypothetical protein
VRLKLTTTTPYYATGLSQSESITARRSVAESSTIADKNAFARLSVETPWSAILNAETVPRIFESLAEPLEAR